VAKVIVIGKSKGQKCRLTMVENGIWWRFVANCMCDGGIEWSQ